MDEIFMSNLLAWSVQVGLLAAVASLVLSLLRVTSPAIRHVWWRAVLALCLVLPLLQPWQVPPTIPLAQVEIVPEAPIEPAAVRAGRSADGSAATDVLSWSRSWPAAVVVVLLAGAAVRFAWLGAGLLRLRRLRGAGTRAEPDEGHAEIQTLTQAGAEIRYVKVLGQPVTFGLRRPVVLLPESLRALPDGVQHAVLAHELWHVRRRDWGWILAEEVVRAVLWFHPAIWYLVSRVQSSREEVVDELTVLVTNSRRSYLEALLAFADEPPLFAAAPFAKRRHLFKRMLLISKEAVMSSRRIIASSVVMVGAILLTGTYGAASFPLVSPAPLSGADSRGSERTETGSAQLPPRDHRPGAVRPATAREQELVAFVGREPNGPTSKDAYFEIAKLQEARAATAEAEATLLAARAAFPNDPAILQALSRFYTRAGQFDRAVAVVEDIAAADPSNPQAHQLVATYYEEKVRKDPSVSPVDRRTYIQKGIDAADRALAASPEYVEAMIYKNILLRHQAQQETDTVRQQQLIAEADALRNRAMELRKTSGALTPAGALPAGAPPPPPPPPPPVMSVDGQTPVRVGGNIKPPTKIHDVRPIYPEDAKAARVQGVVIVEATIDTAGNVYDARVLRSIPILDDAALHAVRQWQFTPTNVNGVPVPVILTVTVNFTLQ